MQLGVFSLCCLHFSVISISLAGNLAPSATLSKFSGWARPYLQAIGHALSMHPIEIEHAGELDGPFRIELGFARQEGGTELDWMPPEGLADASQRKLARQIAMDLLSDRSEQAFSLLTQTALACTPVDLEVSAIRLVAFRMSSRREVQAGTEPLVESEVLVDADVLQNGEKTWLVELTEPRRAVRTRLSE